MTALILAGGTRLACEDFLQLSRSQQARDVEHLAQIIHYGPLADVEGRPTREPFSELTGSGSFDRFIRRSLYGMDIAKLEIYRLDGSVLYSTDPESTSPAPLTHPLVQRARRGNSASELAVDQAFRDLQGEMESRDVVQTFGLMFDTPPDSDEPDRPVAILAAHRDAGGRLDSLGETVRWVAGVFFVGMSSVLVVIHRVSERSRNRLRQANEELRRREAALRESKERMVRADEAAKLAIAEKLHGTVQARLCAIWMKLGMLRDEFPSGEQEALDSVDSLMADLDDIREEDIRQLSHRSHCIRVSFALAPRPRWVATGPL